MRELHLPKDYNYIGIFLALGCNYSCNYCLNHHGKFVGKRKILSAKDWAEGLNRLVLPEGLPVTLQGGEPSLHHEFNKLIKLIAANHPVDLLTNLSFDIEKFISEVSSDKLKRDAPYPSIRVSYHPSETTLENLYLKVKRLFDLGYSIGVYGIDYPHSKTFNVKAKDLFSKSGIIFKVKDFLGYENGVLFGNYIDSFATDGIRKNKSCYVNELLVDPSGYIFRCHRDLYANEHPVGHILDDNILFEDRPRLCDRYGECHPCDVKIKTNRFQIFGHTSASISDGELKLPRISL